MFDFLFNMMMSYGLWGGGFAAPQQTLLVVRLPESSHAQKLAHGEGKFNERVRNQPRLGNQRTFKARPELEIGRVSIFASL